MLPSSRRAPPQSIRAIRVRIGKVCGIKGGWQRRTTRTAAKTPTGALIQNVHRQLALLVSAPPISGPSTVPLP